MVDRLTSRRRTPLADRFWAKVDRRGPDECWGWIGACHVHGYGRIGTVGRETDVAHRVSWEIHFGPIPDGMSVLHHCDNPPCTNPSHLFLGTQMDNNRDMWGKGRGSEPPHPQGELSPHSRLTEEQVRDIRARPPVRHGGLAALAREFGVSRVSIRNILDRRTWKHVA